MGVKNFFKIIIDTKGEWANKTIMHIGKEIKLADLAGKAICFDTPTLIYSAILALKDVSGMTDKDGNVTSHIKTIMSQILMFKKQNISQIWVFDSKKVTSLKKGELQKRSDKRAKSSSEKVQFKMTGKHIEDIQKLLTLMGQVYIVAPDGIEAEQYGAYLTIPKPGAGAMCEYMYSSDADVLIFGGNLLKPMRLSTGKTKKKIYISYKINDVLEVTGLDRFNLAEMAVAMGTDFAEKVPKVGPKSILKKAQQKILELDESQRTARDYFLQDLGAFEPTIVQGTYDREKLIHWLISLGFEKDRLEKQLSEV